MVSHRLLSACRGCSANSLLEVLVVLAAVPVTAPGKAMLGKELIAQVGFVDLVGEGGGAICVGTARHR